MRSHGDGEGWLRVLPRGKHAAAQMLSGCTQAALGGCSFLASLTMSQALQGAVLRVSSASPFGFPTMLGFATVSAASVVAVRVADITAAAMAQGGSGPGLSMAAVSPSAAWMLPADRRDAEGQAGVAALGVLLYRCLGGRFNCIAPSVLHQPGSFSQRWASLDASPTYATGKERMLMQVLGEKLGCHSCGNARAPKYIADHMPPVKTVKVANRRLWRKLLRQPVSQRFYPQCEACSSLQSSAVREGKRVLRYHVGALRAHHATGALLVAAVLLLGAKRGGAAQRSRPRDRLFLKDYFEEEDDSDWP